MKKLIKQIININNYLQLPVPCDKDWDYLIKFCSYHELLPLLFLKYNHQLPPEKQEKFRVNYYFSIARNMVLMEEFLKLKTKFEKTGIEFLPLKGIDFINTIYPDINFRSMTDIDILVPKQKLKKCEQIVINNLGYYKILAGKKEKYWLNYHCHLMYHKILSGINIHLELHWALDFRRFKNINFEQLWNRRKKIFINDTEINILSPEDTIISLGLHQRRFHNPLIIKNIMDAYFILNNYTIDWNYIIMIAYKYRLRTTINLLLNAIQEIYKIDFENIKQRLRIKKFVDYVQKKIISKFIYNSEMFDNSYVRKKVYFQLYFFMYDTWWEVLYYLFFIAPEKFASFFNIPTYSFQNRLWYRLRLLYAPLRLLSIFFKNKV